MKLHAALAFACAVWCAAAIAQPKADANHPGHGAEQAGQAAPWTEGEIRKVDKQARKITIKHGPITNLGMPAMTMVFRVKDPATLDRLAIGEKIRFAAAKIEGTYVVTRIEPLKQQN